MRQGRLEPEEPGLPCRAEREHGPARRLEVHRPGRGHGPHTTPTSSPQHRVIPDGKLCSANNAQFAGLDLPRADFPSTTQPSGREYTLRCDISALHNPYRMEMYATKDGYDPTKPLKRSDLENTPFLSVDNTAAVAAAPGFLGGKMFEFMAQLKMASTRCWPAGRADSVRRVSWPLARNRSNLRRVVDGQLRRRGACVAAAGFELFAFGDKEYSPGRPGGSFRVATIVRTPLYQDLEPSMYYVRSESAVIALGACLGNRMETLQGAVDAFGDTPGLVVEAISPIYEAQCGGSALASPTLSAVALVRTVLAPATLVDRCQAVEEAFQRRREGRVGPHTIDADLVGYAALVCDDPALTLPHPEAHARASVLAPWHCLEPAAVLAGVGPVADLLAAVDTSRVRRRPDLTLTLPGF
ncbi:2-amino-4-hydroxy-6-hydroxymethyldihydropteridine diphosphokinase [Streptomyces vinaceus]|uniref:2-amino-4-hydroxy-6- hydroxymethyldihydropteridine diphosphokinase n=1 Tax=Streptomyces vinaceus TaxID=1960 RepID=UPI003688934F